MLTAITITNLRPKAADYRVADGDGLYLLVRPNGSKLWRYDYRLSDVRRTLSIGEYDKGGDGRYSFTLAQARDEHPASQKLRGIAKADKVAEAVDRTFGALADVWLAARKVNLSPKSYARDVRSVTYLKEGYRTAKGFGALDIEQVEPSHLSNLLEVFNKPTRIWVLGGQEDHGRRQAQGRDQSVALLRHRLQRGFRQAQGQASPGHHRPQQVRRSPAQDGCLRGAHR
jgi:Arm DNA-binding domain